MKCADSDIVPFDLPLQTTERVSAYAAGPMAAAAPMHAKAPMPMTAPSDVRQARDSGAIAAPANSIAINMANHAPMQPAQQPQPAGRGNAHARNVSTASVYDQVCCHGCMHWLS
jgi:hypothetical protein